MRELAYRETKKRRAQKDADKAAEGSQKKLQKKYYEFTGLDEMIVKDMLYRAKNGPTELRSYSEVMKLSADEQLKRQEERVKARANLRLDEVER